MTAAFQPQVSTTEGWAFWTGREAAIGGALLVAVGFLTLLGIIVAESFYPGYNAGVQEISDLGASRPPNSVILEPSATIFNTTMFLAGAMVLLAVPLLHRVFRARGLTAVLALLGVGLLGVGVFDGSEAPIHGLFALLTFTMGGLAAVVAGRTFAGAFRYLSLAVGLFVLGLLVSLVGLGIAGIVHPLAPLGLGGVERLVAYPALLWLLAFGGYTLGQTAEPNIDVREFAAIER